MKLELAYYGNPVLRKRVSKVKKITDEIKKLVAEMVETMHEHNGIGLAAPQVSKSISVFITEVPIPVKNPEDPEKMEWKPGKLRVFINPKILSHGEEEWNLEEGCLSIPGLYGEVVRPVSVKVQAMDLDGNTFEEEFTWMDARCIMHENDHLNGVLFIDRIHGDKRKELEPKLTEIKRAKKKSGAKGKSEI